MQMLYKQHEYRGCTFWDWHSSNAFKFIKHEIDVGAPGSGLKCYDLQQGDVVIDIGAHIGMLSTLMAKENPGVTFYAFEPMPETFEALKRNIKANDIHNVRPLQFGIAGTPCTRFMASNLDDNTGGSTMWAKSSALIHTHSVACITLENAWELAGKGPVKLLKIDCEGAEHEFIRASLNSEFWKHVHHCVGELHENELLNKAGYSNKATQATLGQITSGTVRFQAITMAQ